MSDSKREPISEKEEFELSFQTFVDALKVLKEDAETQCEVMDYYNVAWELKDEVLAGSYLLELPGGNLTDEQKYVIEQLIHELKKIPEDISKEAITEEANLTAMKHSCWEPIRKHSSILLRTLGID